METESSQNSLNLTQAFAAALEDLPQVTQFYRFLLVEELALEDDYSELHIGKCAVIGKLHENAEGVFELENINLPNFSSEFSLPEGIIKLRLVDYCPRFGNDQLHTGRYCEVCGVVCLLKLTKETEKVSPILLTTHDLHLTLRHFTAATTRQEYLKRLKSTYTVAIKVDFLKEIDNASKLAEHNLALRRF